MFRFNLFVTVRRSILFACFLLAGCAAVNRPINEVAGSASLPAEFASISAAGDDEVYIGLAFSGGGTRASSFGYGLLEELRATNQTKENPDGLLKHVKLVSGVSGGSVTAAYYGLYGPGGLDRYRETYLIKNAEKYMATRAYNPFTLARGLGGGVNNRRTFARFLDESIFKKATFADFAKQPNLITWINATDIANKTPFLFAPETFNALCSDLSKLPVSEAVAASAALPIVFSPIVLTAHGEACEYQPPDWLVAARFNPESTSVMRAYAKSLESYRDPEKVRFVKLLDGGVTDNFGTTGLSLARAKAQNAYGPLTAQQAVKLKRILFLVANAGTEKNYKWTQRVRGPGGVQLALSTANSAIGASSRVGFDVMRLTLDLWHRDLVDYRCGLSQSEVRKLRGSTKGWDCTDLKLFVGEVAFDGLDEEMVAELNVVPTRLKLPEEQVDLVIDAARQATRSSPVFNGFLRSLEGFEGAASSGARKISPRKISPVTN